MAVVRGPAVGGLQGFAQTVLGPVEPSSLGITLPHEHLLIDTSHLIPAPTQATDLARFHSPVTIDLLGYLKYGSGWNLDNTRLLDSDTAIAEALLFKYAGGMTIVDASNHGIARDARGLAAIARATGLHVIMGASYYVDASHPRDMADRTEASLADGIANEFDKGVGPTSIRPGIIGEVGCSFPITANETKVLRASAIAQRRTGAALLIHPGRDQKSPMEIVEVLRDAGADLSRTVISHIDRTVFAREDLLKLAGTGCTLEYDMFGWENSYYRTAPHIDIPNDADRLRTLAWLVSEGLERQLLVSHDIDKKYRLVRYGGHGYAHIVENIAPRMRTRGLSAETVRRLLIDNPARLLTFVEPEQDAQPQVGAAGQQGAPVASARG